MLNTPNSTTVQLQGTIYHRGPGALRQQFWDNRGFHLLRIFFFTKKRWRTQPLTTLLQNKQKKTFGSKRVVTLCTAGLTIKQHASGLRNARHWKALWFEESQATFGTHWKNYLCPSSPSQLPTPKKQGKKLGNLFFVALSRFLWSEGRPWNQKSWRWNLTYKTKASHALNCGNTTHHPHPPTQLTKQLTNHNQLESLKFSFVQLGQGTSTQNVIMLVIRRVVAFEPNGSLTLGPPRRSFRKLCAQKIPENAG